MRLKIVQAGDPVLRAQTRQLTRQEIMSDEIQRLVKDMRETMQDAPGVGLAAPHVGVPLRVAVVEDRGELWSALPEQELTENERHPVPFHIIINPEITLLGEDWSISMKVVSACLDFRPSCRGPVKFVLLV